MALIAEIGYSGRTYTAQRVIQRNNAMSPFEQMVVTQIDGLLQSYQDNLERFAKI